MFSYRFSVRDDREPVSFMLSIIAILQTKNHDGYVGGAGEFFLISLYANEINECLLMVGGTIMSNKMWTSTQSTQFTYSWYYDINIQGDHLDTSTRSNPRYVRPFTELIL